jgi:hypothetical protein
MISDYQINKNLTSLEEYFPSVGVLHGKTKAVIKLYSSFEMKGHGIPTTELFIEEDNTFDCRNYGLRTVECIDTLTRAGVLIRALGLKPRSI